MSVPEDQPLEVQPMPDDIARLAEQITGAPDAPEAYRALRARVHSGSTSWESWWADPSSVEWGGRLLREVVAAQLAEVRELMDLPAPEPDED